jgi:hypothetical protein
MEPDTVGEDERLTDAAAELLLDIVLPSGYSIEKLKLSVDVDGISRYAVINPVLHATTVTYFFSLWQLSPEHCQLSLMTTIHSGL